MPSSLREPKLSEMAPLILGLHGLLPGIQSPGVHDASYCLLEPNSGRIERLVEMEKLSGVRHDGRLDAELLRDELGSCRSRGLEIATSHFTPFQHDPKRQFPLFRGAQLVDTSDLRHCEERRRHLLGNAFPNYVYLHELAHVFSAYMYRDEEFLGLVVEGSGSFTQSCLFRIAGFRVQLLEYNLPVLSGHFFQQWLSRYVFDIDRRDYAGRAATPGKAMALAAYGDPERFKRPLLHAVGQHPAGKYINYREGFCPELENRNLSWKDRVDLCAAGQAAFEELLVREASRIRKRYGNLPLYYAGGCALSVKTNSRLRAIFDNLVIPPNCADDGQALGLAALHAFLKYRVLAQPLGPNTALQANHDRDLNLIGGLTEVDLDQVVSWLARGEMIGWAQGMPEIGPRALCRRSILACPAQLEMRHQINHIKEREYYRPVAPVVLHSAGDSLFEGYFFSPYMLYDFPVRPECRGLIPAALHKDGTARVQSVLDDRSDIARLLKKFAEKTGKPPVLLNTSLNARGKPIAATSEQLSDTFSTLKINHLVLGARIFTPRNGEVITTNNLKDQNPFHRA